MNHPQAADSASVDQKVREAEAALTAIADAVANVSAVYRDSMAGIDRSNLSEHHRKMVQLADHGLQTSRAVELLRRSGLELAALALVRVRLEETIVSSYLINENSQELYRRYFEFGPINDLRMARAATKDAYLATHMATQINLEELEQRASVVEASFNPGFTIEGGMFTPKWTSLDLYSMAVRRDQLASNRKPDLATVTPLASLYTSLYRTASSVVHSDGSVISSPFVGALKGADGVMRDCALFWRMSIPSYLLACDNVQCTEMLRSIVEEYGREDMQGVARS
jgi:hypothetical protein